MFKINKHIEDCQFEAIVEKAERENHKIKINGVTIIPHLIEQYRVDEDWYN